MTRRTYDQFCGAAHALDVVGERWTLLIVRELLTGPKRFKDLLAYLPGISTNLLSQRLKHLGRHDLVEKIYLPPPASTGAYALTDEGRYLEAVLLELARWGFRSLPAPRSDTAHFFSATALAMQAVARSGRVADGNDVFEFHIDDDVFFARLEDGRFVAETGRARRPDAILTTSSETLRALIAGSISVKDARRRKQLRLEGEERACARCAALLDTSPLREPSDASFKAIDLTGRPATGTRRLG